jgi:putative membrane protein
MFDGDGWGYMFMGPVVMIAFTALVVLLVVLAFRWLSADHGRRSMGADDAMAVLRERFARGEIDEEEFEARRRALRRSEAE